MEIVAGDSFFDPERIDLPAAGSVTFEVTNAGDIPHEFSIDELDISTGTIEPGEVKSVTFDVPEGDTEFACAFHEGMTGTIATRQTSSDGPCSPWLGLPDRSVDDRMRKKTRWAFRGTAIVSACLATIQPLLGSFAFFRSGGVDYEAIHLVVGGIFYNVALLLAVFVPFTRFHRAG